MGLIGSALLFIWFESRDYFKKGFGFGDLIIILIFFVIITILILYKKFREINEDMVKFYKKFEEQNKIYNDFAEKLKRAQDLINIKADINELKRRYK